jgi:hypothetical protein
MVEPNGVRAHLLTPQENEWRALLEEVVHDFYHLPGYVAASAPNDGGEPRALIVEDGERRLLLPLVVREVGDGASMDACSPYGYPGPVQSGEHDPTFQRAALQAGIERLRELGYVSLFIRTHPLLNPEPPQGVGTVVQHGVTVSIDLSLSEEEHWKQTRRNHRQQIRQALNKGYESDVGDGARYMGEFMALYRATMQARGADAYYFFADDYFEALPAIDGCDVHIAVATLDGQVAAAGMFVVTGDIVQMHLTGHDSRYMADQPMKLVFDAVRTWAREQGLRVLHLGGGRGGAEDSLLHFKAGFSPLRQPYHTVRVVIDEPAYARLVHAREPSVDPSDHSGTFPGYRGES